jgi:O-acetyl-ADP-ribose deacetylase (regulator of RNase III)
VKKEAKNDGSLTLAFPSISTSTFEFDVNKAAQMGCQAVSDFLRSHPDPQLRLILVDKTNSETLQAFRKVKKAKLQ